MKQRGAGCVSSKPLNCWKYGFKKRNKIYIIEPSSNASSASQVVPPQPQQFPHFDPVIELVNRIPSETNDEQIRRQVKCVVDRAFKNVIDNAKIKQNKEANKSNPLLSLPELALLNIIHHVNTQITGTKDLAILKTVATSLNDNILKYKEVNNTEKVFGSNRIVTKCFLKKVFFDFLMSQMPLWEVLARYNSWTVIEIVFFMKIINGSKTYYIGFPFGITTDYVRENKCKFDFSIGDADSLDCQTVSINENLQSLLDKFADVAAQYVTDNIDIVSNTVVYESGGPRPLGAKVTTAFFLHIFDSDLRQPRYSIIDGMIDRTNERLLQETNAAIRERYPGHLVAANREHGNEGDLELLNGDNLLIRFSAIANWIAGPDNKVVIVESCNGGGGGASQKKVYTVLEKRVISGKLRNVYKCRGERKLYVRVDKKYISLKEFRAMTAS